MEDSWLSSLSVSPLSSLLPSLYPLFYIRDQERYHGKAGDEDIQKVLYSPAKQGEVRLIYATSTAETALTIEGLVIVVDPGVYPSFVTSSLPPLFLTLYFFFCFYCTSSVLLVNCVFD